MGISQEERRSRIIACAIELFGERGYTSTTMDQVAAAANITKRTLYRYVNDKETLLFDVCQLFTSSILNTGRNGPVATPEEHFADLVRRHLDAVTSNPMIVRIFVEERKMLSRENWTKIESQRDAYESYAATIVARAQSPTFRPSATSVVTHAVLGTLTAAYRWYNPAGPASPGTIAQIATDFFLHGLVRAPTQWAPEDITAPALPAASDEPTDRIKKAAARLFTEVGYHAAPTRAVADIANVTKGGLFYHIHKKENLLASIQKSVLRDALEVMQAAVEAGGSALEVVSRIIQHYLWFVARHRDQMVVVDEYSKYLEPAARAEVTEMLESVEGMLRTALEAGSKNGEFVVADSGIVIQLIVGMLRASYRWVRLEEPTNANEFFDDYARLVLFGLAGDALAA